MVGLGLSLRATLAAGHAFRPVSRDTTATSISPIANLKCILRGFSVILLSCRSLELFKVKLTSTVGLRINFVSTAARAGFYYTAHHWRCYKNLLVFQTQLLAAVIPDITRLTNQEFRTVGILLTEQGMEISCLLGCFRLRSYKSRRGFVEERRGNRMLHTRPSSKYVRSQNAANWKL